MALQRFPMRPWERLLAGLAGYVALSFVFLLVPLSTSLSSWGQSPARASAPSDSTLRERGRQVFTEKCGSCHDADAAKKLSDGSTLLGRLAARKDPQAKLGTRLKSMSEQDARGVSLYMEDLLARFRAAQPNSVQK